MRNKKISLRIILTVILLLPSSLLSKSLYKFVYSPKSDIYFGHISVIDVQYDGLDAVVFREGEKAPELAAMNLPLTAGDKIRTTERRCEVRFDTGTSIRLDLDTELKLETVLAQSLSSRDKLTNLVLLRGQIYILYRRYNRGEVFQVITPQAAVKMKDKAVASVKVEDDGKTEVRVKSGEAHVLYGPDADQLKKEKIKKTQKAIITADHRPLFLQEQKPDPDLNLWGESVETYLRVFPESGGFVPILLRKYREPVSFFVKKFSDLHGSWMMHYLYGFIWRPDANDDYPDGNWQPYVYGRWRELNGLLFWVPEEEWGWVPYHLGLWMWDDTHGWLWIPGFDFAPAWVSWDYFWGYHAWRPWALWDWYGPYGYAYSQYYYNYLYRQVGILGPDDKKKEGKTIRRVIKKDQLKRKGDTQFVLPKSQKKVYKKVVTAMKNNDPKIIRSLEKLPEHVILVASPGLNASRIQERRIKTAQVVKGFEASQRLEQVLPPTDRERPHQMAVWSFRRNKEIVDIRNYIMFSFSEQRERTFLKKGVGVSQEKITPLQIEPNGVSQRTAVPFPAVSGSDMRKAMRIRDWNPDIKVARRLGVQVIYESCRNVVSCPALGLSSRNVKVSGPSRGFYPSNGGGSSESSSSESSRESTSSGPDRSSSGSKTVKSTGKIKKK